MAYLLVTPTRAYRYTRSASESWFAALSRPPQVIDIPQFSQTEAICFAADGKSLFISSENLPAKRAEVLIP